MTDQISAKEYNLWDLMSGNFIFSIPDYQRPYSWTENEAVTLWDDLLEFWQDAKNSASQTYFVGSIVLVKSKESPESEVIDGQQRISTLSLILSILSEYSLSLKNDIQKCLWEEGIQFKKIDGRPRLSLRKRDADFFKKYIAKGKVNELLQADPKKLADDSQRLIFRNAIILAERIKTTFENQQNEVDSFITALFGQCFFVVVTTPDNESAFRVFSVMNNRGLSLLPSDIINAHIIGEIDEKSRQYYTDKWEDIEVDLGRESFNALLSHIRMIYARSKLHGTLVSEFERTVFKGIENRSEIITSIIEPYAKAYKAILCAGYTASTGAGEVNELLSWLNRVDDADWIPAMMCAIVRCGNDAQFIMDFTRGLEKTASCFYLTSRTSNQRIEKYARIIAALQEQNEQKALEELALTVDEKKEFLEVLDGDVYLMPARKRTYLVLRLDRFISDKAAEYKNSIFSIEHVLPQNPRADSQWIKDWPDENVREFWVHKIANLVPLTRKKNSQAQNYDYEIKKDRYFAEKGGVTSYAMTTEILSIKEWTPSVVAERQNRLMGVFAKHWELTPSRTDSREAKTSRQEVTIAAEQVRQEKLMAELSRFFATNPETKLPKLPEENVKAGEFVHRAMHKLCESEYEITQRVIRILCTVEGSRKYTHRNLPFLVPVDAAEPGSNMLKRYWVRKEYIETLNGRKYYVYSQWYPDHKDLSDAHRSDFMQLYLDLALNKI